MAATPPPVATSVGACLATESGDSSGEAGNAGHTCRRALADAGLLHLVPSERRDGWVVLGPTVAGGPMIYLQPVSEPKTGTARAHLDLWVDDLDAAVAQAEELGGQRTSDRHDDARGSVVVMTDPEGHEFCLIWFPSG